MYEVGTGDVVCPGQMPVETGFLVVFDFLEFSHKVPGVLQVCSHLSTKRLPTSVFPLSRFERMCGSLLPACLLYFLLLSVLVPFQKRCYSADNFTFFYTPYYFL